jgi:hypothetical protein
MNIDFQEILKELEYRLPHGIINLNEDSQVTTLVDILRENGVSDANEYAQRARAYFGFINEASKNNPLDTVITYTGKDKKQHTIKVSSGLNYDEKHPGYIAAVNSLKKDKVSPEKIKSITSKAKQQEPKQLGGAELVGGAEKRAAEKQLGGVELKTDLEKEKQIQRDDKQKVENAIKVAYKGASAGSVIGNENESDNKVKNDMLKYGFKGYQKKTGKKPAPGSEGSAFNEIISGEGVKILEKAPDLSETELTRVIVKQFCGTALGKEQSQSTTVVRELPSDLKNNNCASKALIAAKSARNKFNSANQTKQELESKGLLSKNSKINAFYGADDSKSAQITMAKEAKSVMMPDGTVVDKDDAVAFIAAGGGGQNPSDTAVFIQDDQGNVVIKFYSDKTSTADIQDNSTLSQEINDRITQIDTFEKNKILTKDQATKAKAIVANHAKNISKIESTYSDGNTLVAQNLSNNGKGFGDKEQLALLNSGRDKTLLKNLSEAVESKKGYKKEIIENLPKGCDPNKPTTECLYLSLRKVVARGPEFTEEQAIAKLKAARNENPTQKQIDTARNSPSGAQQKVIAKISGMLTSDFINAGKEVPDGIDVNSIVSVQRKKVVESYHKMNRDLDQITVKVGNTKKGIGTLAQSEDVIDSFHLGLMDSPPKKYKKGDIHSMMGQCFEVSMGGPMVNGEMLRQCLSVKNTQEFKEKFSVKETQELTYEFSEKQAIEKLKANGIEKPNKKQLQNARNVTGMKIFSYAMDNKTKESQEVGFRTYRGKAGKTSKTSTTMQYSDGMRKCFDSKSKNKK